MEETQRTKPSFWAEVLDFVKSIAIAAVVAFIITRGFLPLAVVPSSSMESTLPTNSLIVCTKPSYWFSSPQRGDVVMFKRAETTGDNSFYVKRIVGEPGDIVTIKAGVTYINGEEYSEPWLNETPFEEDFGPFEVPEGKYFCMGDNRNASWDCRYWEEHFVPENRISAKVQIVLSGDKFAFVGDGR